MLVGSNMSTLPTHPNGSLRRVAATTRRDARLVVVHCALAALAFVALAMAGMVLVGGAMWPAPAHAAPATTAASADAVVVAPRDFSDGDSLIATLSSAGARPLVVYLPRTALASVTPAAAGQLRGEGYTILRAGAAVSGATANTAAALATLNDLAGAASAAGSESVVPSGLASLGDDVKFPGADGATGTTVSAVATNATTATDATSVSSLTAVAGLAAPAFLGGTGWLPTASEPAAFAAGSVAVSIIFPQSTRTHSAEIPESWATPDPDTAYDQPDAAYPTLSAREGYIVAEVSKTLVWWADRNPAAHLTFVIPAAGDTGAPQQVPFKGAKVAGKTVLEPIDIPSTDDHAWRHPLMRALGVPSATAADSPPPETAYDDAVRKANHTDWAFTLYCVDSLKESSGAFPDGAFAYVFDVFGPYAVTTWDNGRITGPESKRNGYGPGLFDGVVAHEIGHIFGALDEYKPPTAGYPSTGDLFSGYLWVKNDNAFAGGTTNDVCIMRGGQEGIDAYEGVPYKGEAVTDGGICPSTRGQIGWRDANGNGIPDVLDTTPTVKLKPATSSDGLTATVSGVAGEKPCPPGGNAQGHAFSRGISIPLPHDVLYRVDGGAWVEGPAVTTPVAEAFSFTTAALGPGPYSSAPTRHVIHVSLTTGSTATSSVVAWVGATPVTLALTTATPTIALGARVTLTLHATTGTGTVYPIGFLPGVSVGVAGDVQKVVTTGPAGRAAVSFAPRFTAAFRAVYQPVGQAQFEAASSLPLTVSVRARLTAHADTPSAAGVVGVSGSFRPVRSGVPIMLQQSVDGVWKVVARTQTSASATFSLHYTAPAGTVRLRVRFAGDATNAAATRLLPTLVVP